MKKEKKHKKQDGRPKIPEASQRLLWGCSAGRCEFQGCNKPLWKAPTTKQQVNIAEVAHIIAFSAFGPRGKKTVSSRLAKDLSNLMLLCGACHTLIDDREDDYHVELLREMKRKHERRVELATSIHEDKSSHILLYGANIGQQSSLVSYEKAAAAMLPDSYPADTHAITFGMLNSSFSDCSDSFWRIETANLRQKTAQLLRPRLATGEIKRLSIFALAPQPLLILLGSLIPDVTSAEVFQKHREPDTWAWQPGTADFSYTVLEPSKADGTPALVFSLSASVTDDRICAVLGDNTSIWKVTIAEPNNDFLKTKQQAQAFRQQMRRLLDRMKERHGEKAVIHVFPAMPVALAVEFGRIIMPKADLPLAIYDQNRVLGGFVKALDVNTPSVGGGDAG
ncbi:MAG: SAVED domain-containing protein [Verrucomicrobiia bacterium]